MFLSITIQAFFGKIFHEGANTQNQDYMHSWTPSTTNAATG
eukprot:SAG31_NODE_16608_length_702_cov_5.067993_1_plen_40_part_01